MIASQLPHDGNARFVGEVVESGDECLECIGRIPVESPFVEDGLVPGFVLMELAAQVAAIDLLKREGSAGSRPRIG